METPSFFQSTITYNKKGRLRKESILLNRIFNTQNITIMKKLFKTFAILLLATATTFATTSEDDKKKVKQPTSFDIGMYNVKNTSTIRLMLEKAKGDIITIKLRDETGDILHKEVVRKNNTFYKTNFQLDGLSDGTYQFEISSDNEKVVREVTVSTNVPTPVVYKELTIN